jgi:hypothetical protein
LIFKKDFLLIFPQIVRQLRFHHIDLARHLLRRSRVFDVLARLFTISSDGGVGLVASNRSMVGGSRSMERMAQPLGRPGKLGTWGMEELVAVVCLSSEEKS